MKAEWIPATLVVLAAAAATSQAGALYTAVELDAPAYGWALNSVGEVAGHRGNDAAVWSGGAATYLGTLGGPQSVAWDINDAGLAVGESLTIEDEYNTWHAFSWQHGVMTDLGTLGGGVSRAFAVNDLGHIVGEAETQSGAMHAFLWQEGTMTDLGTLAGDYSSAWDINSHGQVVGLSTGQNGRLRAFLWADAQFSDLGTLGGGWSAAEGINDAGQIVGVSEVADGVVHAFLWEDGVMRDIHGLAAEESWAKAINISGAVVGYWKNPGLNGGGFVYDTQAGMRDLALYLPPDLNWSGGSGRDINDAGQIAGCTVVVEGGHGTNTAFLLTPIPEPASLALLGLGACAVLARAFVVDTHRGRVNSHIGF